MIVVKTSKRQPVTQLSAQAAGAALPQQRDSQHRYSDHALTWADITLAAQTHTGWPLLPPGSS